MEPFDTAFVPQDSVVSGGFYGISHRCFDISTQLYGSDTPL
jgi:hypothetical protein